MWGGWGGGEGVEAAKDKDKDKDGEGECTGVYGSVRECTGVYVYGAGSSGEEGAGRTVGLGEWAR